MCIVHEIKMTQTTSISLCLASALPRVLSASPRPRALCLYLCLCLDKTASSPSLRRRSLPGGAGRPKFNQLEMITTFTYIHRLQTQFCEDRCAQFRVVVLTDPPTVTGRPPSDHVAPLSSTSDSSATPRWKFDLFDTRFVPPAGSRSISLPVNSCNVDLCLSGCEQ